MSYPIPPGAKCRIESAILCDYTPIFDNAEVVKEICRFCHRVQLYKKIGGRVDNKKYGEDHLRDYLQPEGATKGLFLKIYGGAGIKRAVAELKRRAEVKKNSSVEVMQDYARDTLKTVQRLEGKGLL